MGEAVEDSTSVELDSSSARTKAAAKRAVAPIAKRIALACCLEWAEVFDLGAGREKW
jgi:hypothetical protein